jgi:hypothetical protein
MQAELHRDRRLSLCCRDCGGRVTSSRTQRHRVRNIGLGADCPLWLIYTIIANYNTTIDAVSREAWHDPEKKDKSLSPTERRRDSTAWSHDSSTALMSSDQSPTCPVPASQGGGYPIALPSCLRTGMRASKQPQESLRLVPFQTTFSDDFFRRLWVKLT